MTAHPDLLRSVLEERAESLTPPSVDLQAVLSSGLHRRRRRQAAVLASAMAATCLIAGAAVALRHPGDGGGRGVGVASGSPAADVRTARASWAQGHDLHTADGVVRLPQEVRAFARTAVGYVAAAPDGTVWSVVDGRVSEVGTSDLGRPGTDDRSPRLVADPVGRLAAWYDPDGSDPAVLVLDQATGQATRVPWAGVRHLVAVSGQVVYVQTRDGLATLRTDSGVRDEPDVGPGRLAAVAGDTQLFLGRDGGATAVGPSGTAHLQDAYADVGYLSPGGAYASVDADEPLVYRAADGERVDLGTTGFATVVDWLDDRHAVLLAQPDPAGPVVLETCTVPEGACERDATLAPSFDALLRDGFALPVGLAITD